MSSRTSNHGPWGHGIDTRQRNIFSKEKSLINQLSLSWGVRAFYYGEEDTLDDIVEDQIEILKERGFLKTGDTVVSTGSTPVHLHLPTNILKITKVE